MQLVLKLLIVLYRVNSLPKEKILDLSKLKTFADDNLNVYQKLKFALGRVENIVGKEENAGYQRFLPFHNVFKRLLPLERKKSGLYGKELSLQGWDLSVKRS